MMKRFFSSLVIVIAVLIGFSFVASNVAALYQVQEYWVRVEDGQGKPVTSATITVYTADTATQPTIYSDDQATVQSNGWAIDTTSGGATWWGSASSYDVVIDADTQQSKETITLQKHRIIIPSQLENREIVTYNLPGTTAATAGNYSAFYIAEEDMELVSVNMRWETASSGGEGFMLVKAASGTAISAGTDMLSASLATSGTAATNYSGVLHATLVNIQMSEGDALGIVANGVTTSMTDYHCTTELKKR